MKTVKWRDNRETEREISSRGGSELREDMKKRFEVDAIICYSKAPFSRVVG